MKPVILLMSLLAALSGCAHDAKPAAPKADAAADSSASDGGGDAKSADQLADASAVPDALPGDATADGAAVQDSAADTPPGDVALADGGCTQTAAWCASNDTVAECVSGVVKELPCGPFQVCLQGKCKVQVCAPASTKCEGKKIVACDDSGTQATTLQDCAAEDKVCEKAACKASICPGGTKKCDGEVAMACSPAGTEWLKLADCGGANSVCHEGSCIPIPCKDGGKGCVNNQAVACKGAGWSVIDDCKGAGNICAAGACAKAACNVGDFDCTSGMAIACQAPGLVWSPPLACPPTTQCTAGIGCTKGPCMPDEEGCSGSQPVVCDPAGVPTPTGADCANSGQVCTAGKCAPQLCKPGAQGCQGNVRSICSDSGAQWLTIEDCGAQTCSDGLCVPKTCGQGQTTCKGAEVAICDGAWKTSACTAGNVCSQGGCVAPACTLDAPKGGVLVVASLPLATLQDACDLDNNGTKDQALGGFSQISQGTSSAQAALGRVLVLQPLGPGPDAVALLPAIVTPTSGWATCPGANCNISIAPDAYELTAIGGTCPARSLLDPVAMSGDKLLAGGPGTAVWVPLQLGALAIEVPLLGARLQGTVAQAGGGWSGVKGVLCGAIAQAQLIAAIDALPDTAVGSAANKLALEKLLAGLAPPDLDLDGDGKPDALSAAFVIQASGSTSLGLAQ